MPVPPPISSMGRAVALGGTVGEAAQRAFNGQQRVELVVVEQTIAELSADDPPDMQLERTRVMRRRCDREAAAPSARQQDVDVLAGFECESFGERQPQEQSHDVVRQRDCALDAARQALARGAIGGLQLKGFHDQVAARARLAEQDQAVGDLGRGQAQRRPIRIVDLAAHEARLAGAAIAALAAVRQVQGGALRRIEQRLIRCGLEAAAGVGDGDDQLWARGPDYERS